LDLSIAICPEKVSRRAMYSSAEYFVSQTYRRPWIPSKRAVASISAASSGTRSGGGGGHSPGRLFADGVVDLLDVGEERVVVGGEGVLGAPEGEMTGRPQQLVRLAVADRRVDPVPCGRRVDKVELVALVVPDLERGNMDLGGHAGQVLARVLGEAHTQLDADDGETTFCNGRVAFPVAQPISRSRARGRSSASSTRSSKS
jgi:hypothetical protein